MRSLLKIIVTLAFSILASHLGFAASKPRAQQVYKNAGGRELALHIDAPDDWNPTDKRPAIVFFFGGGWRAGTPNQFKAQAEYFAKRGLVCLRADYRVRSKDQVLPDKCVEDAISAMRWVRANAARLGIDPDRIVAAGGSAGGHLAACTFFVDDISTKSDDKKISPKPNAMILYNPVVDLVACQETNDRTLVEGLDASVMKRISPSYLLTKDMPPTLVIDGTADRFYKQISAFVDKSKALGAPVEVSYVEGQPHGFFNKPQWKEKTTETAADFLKRLGYL
ncbi:alpha/beta hydrolase [Termitidicoccus mucosus]|uniref:BD-FAE-like domain-containing protein n=1 Tax=Termitidicoccus mucosus TaxID=1184151 RepID=A0A178IP66_9BACT|nr:hypothetical protein AW736_05230 [Opitutaceae bacterium TSB47]